MSARDLHRLAAILARLASPYDGERAAAGLLATRELARLGLSWEGLLTPRPPPCPPPGADWRSTARACQSRPDILTEWQRNFVASILRQTRITDRQQEVLMRIAARLA